MSGTTQKQALPVAFIVSVTVTLRTCDVDTFLEHFRPMHRAATAEPECSYFIVGSAQQAVTQDISAPILEDDAEELTEFRSIAGWTKDFQWFTDVQLKKPYYVPFFEATEKLFAKPRVIEIFQPVEGLSEFRM